MVNPNEVMEAIALTAFLLFGYLAFVTALTLRQTVNVLASLYDSDDDEEEEPSNDPSPRRWPPEALHEPSLN